MYRQVKYQLKIQPLPHKNLRKNINAYYLILISDKDSHKIFSQPLLIDSQRQNDIYSTNDIEYNKIQLWNYDKMKLIEQHKVSFSMSQTYTFNSKIQQISYSIVKIITAKTNKNIDSQKSKQSSITPISSGRKNSQGQYQQLLKNAKNRQQDGSIKTQSSQQSSSNIRNNKSPYRIISSKQYHAY